MASGTPVLSAKLEGIPEEYNDYLYYFDDKKDGDLARKIREILDTPTDELEKRGSDIKSFVLSQKNNVLQSKKIIDFITENKF